MSPRREVAAIESADGRRIPIFVVGRVVELELGDTLMCMGPRHAEAFAYALSLAASIADAEPIREAPA